MPEEKEEKAKAEASGPAVKSAAVAQLKDPGSYWLTRIVYIRALGLIYCNELLIYMYMYMFYASAQYTMQIVMNIVCTEFLFLVYEPHPHEYSYTVSFSLHFSCGISSGPTPEQGAAGEEWSPPHSCLPHQTQAALQGQLHSVVIWKHTRPPMHHVITS